MNHNESLPPAPVDEPTDRAIVRVLFRLGETNMSRLVQETGEELKGMGVERSPKTILKRTRKLAGSARILLRRASGRRVVYSLNTSQYDFSHLLEAEEVVTRSAMLHLRDLRKTILQPWRDQLPILRPDGVFVASENARLRIQFRPPLTRLPVESQPLFSDVSNHVSSADDPAPVWQEFKKAVTTFWAFYDSFRDGAVALLTNSGWQFSDEPEQGTFALQTISTLFFLVTMPPPGSLDSTKLFDFKRFLLKGPRDSRIMVAEIQGEQCFHSRQNEGLASFRHKVNQTWSRAMQWAGKEGRALARVASDKLDDLVGLRNALDRRLVRCEKILLPSEACPFIRDSQPASAMSSKA